MSLKLDGTGKITGIDQGLNVVGVGTFSSNLNVSGDVVVGGGLTITGNLNYENVTDIDSIGVITARSGIIGDLTGNVTGNVTGDITGNIIGSPTLSGISSSISDTAVDIFVYDTSKDSDGGAWRKRTQHTSWYNETLNTATRGSRREFPAVAVIVAESSTVTIYDGDDPDLPMWMVFNVANDTWLKHYSSGSDCSCVTALNGEIVTGGNGNGIRLSVVRFIHDNGYVSEASFTYRHQYISTRNSTPVGPSDTTNPRNIVNNTVNDVAMTVLPSAPIDSGTGLPVPTIAVATDGGVSVIRDDGNVYDVIDTNSARICYDVSFTKDNKIMHTGDLGAGGSHAGNVFVTNVLTADRAEYDNHSDLYRWYSTSSMYPRINGGNTFNTRVLDPIDVGGDHYAMADVGISLIEDGTSSSYGNTDGMVAYATTSYNSGWMHGDIKGAFLSDTDTTNASVSTRNLITNSTFADTSNWTGATNGVLTAPTGLGSYASGTVLRITNTGGANGRAISNTFSTTVGKQYGIRISFTNRSSNAQYRIEVRQSGNDLTPEPGTTTAGYYNYQFISAGTGTYFVELYCLGADGEWAEFDDVYVYELEQDRSVNAKGLTVYGTITKSAVATGAELVAYSGFSGSNVLVQPYNSDLNPGTGNYSFMCWFKCPSTGAEQILMRRFGVPTVTGGTMMRIVSSSSVIQWYVRDTSSTATAVNSTMALDDGNWHCAVGTREGSTAKLYIDGELNATSGCSANSHDPGTTADFVIGAEEVSASPGTYQNPADLSSLTLVRYSLSAPSAAQVKKMYEDEKFLFQENAACTLYGSSDAVTALAYDEVTEQLHVGTSSGRSDFQGLRRINNTTTAVTTAISAHDEFIAEQ